MQVKNLLDILAHNGFRKDGDAHHVAAAVNCPVYLGPGHQALVNHKVQSIQPTVQRFRSLIIERA